MRGLPHQWFSLHFQTINWLQPVHSNFVPASSDLLGSCTLCRSSACSRSSRRRSPCLWGTWCCHVCWEGVAYSLLRIVPNCWDSNVPTRLSSALPADQNLFRLEGVGCHDPGRHSEHDRFGEDGCFGNTLWKRNTGSWVTSERPPPSLASFHLGMESSCGKWSWCLLLCHTHSVQPSVLFHPLHISYRAHGFWFTAQYNQHCTSAFPVPNLWQ